MPLFCKQCNDRRLPIFQEEEKETYWHCPTCSNFVDAKDMIIREVTESEKNEMDTKLEKLNKSIESLPGETLTRRKGVN